MIIYKKKSFYFPINKMEIPLNKLKELAIFLAHIKCGKK